jgi:hypothetical protein
MQRKDIKSKWGINCQNFISMRESAKFSMSHEQKKELTSNFKNEQEDLKPENCETSGKFL